MTTINTNRPQRLQSDDLVLERLENELMVYDPVRKKAFCLNQTAAFVWEHSDGETTVPEMAEMLGRQCNEPVNEQVIWFALDLLSKEGLLAPSTVLPVVAAAVTRRQMLQRLGAGAAVAVPMITVLFVSPAKAHASSLGLGQPPGPPPPDVPDASNGSNHPHGGFWEWLENLF